MKSLLISILLLCGVAHAQTCTTTISTGANLSTTISSAATGDVICLNSGSWGSQTVENIQKSGRITIRSTTGVGAQMSLTVRQVSNMIFKSLTLDGVAYMNENTPRSTNITFADNVINGSDNNFLIDGTGTGTNEGLLIYGNTFANGYQSSGFEGTIHITAFNSTSGNKGITIAHNTFDGSGACSDGIQITGNVNGVTIGPGNVFRDWVQGSCGPHVDAFQFVGTGNHTVIGNYFENNTVNVGIYDGADNIVIKDNIFNGDNGATQSFQIGGVQGMTFSHNTLKDVTGGIGSKAANSPNSSWVIENNVFVNTDWSTASSDQDEGCGSGCLFRYNVIDSGSAFSIVATPTNTVSGSPTFVGGSSPTTWPGWKLSGGSNGKAAGNDGKDMGTLYYKRGPVTGVN